MSRVRDKADFQFAGEDYTHGGGVKYVANMIQTTDLTASGVITDIHLQDIADLTAVTSANDGHYLYYDHSTTSFKWQAVSSGSTLTIQDEGTTLSTDATTLNFVGTGVTATGTGATKTITINSGGGGSMNDLVDDASPQLGGNLDLNGNDILTGDNRIAYASSGTVSFMDFTVTQFGQNNNTVLSSVKSINMFLDSNGGDTGQAFRIYNNTNPDSSPTENTYIFKVEENGVVRMTNNLDITGGGATTVSYTHLTLPTKA